MEIGLFPLGVSLVPGERLPLHIFEERYKDLVADCRERGASFALLYADDKGAREIGCTAAVVEVVERFDDGRMNIVVEGGEVVRVVEMTRGRSYMTAVVEPAADDPDGDAPPEQVAAAQELYRRVAELSGADPALDPAGRPLSYAIAARIEFPAAEKQDLLELRSEAGRLAALTALLQRGLEQLAAAREVARRAQGNGKVGRPRGPASPPG
jgi:Lon protease-like protein